MSESQGRDLKPPEDGMFSKNFGFGTFFWYHDFQNEIDAWESTVEWILCDFGISFRREVDSNRRPQSRP